MKPALTPEEWASLGGATEADSAFFFGGARVRVREDPHATAAVCLYGQPYGFTREDVEDERSAYRDAVVLARHYQESGMEGERLACIARAARHMGRADRIGALLPPVPPADLSVRDNAS